MRISLIIHWLLALSLLGQPCLSAMLTVCDCASNVCTLFVDSAAESGEPQEQESSCCLGCNDFTASQTDLAPRSVAPTPPELGLPLASAPGSHAPASESCDHTENSPQPCCSTTPIPAAVTLSLVLPFARDHFRAPRLSEPDDLLPDAALSRLRRPPRTTRSN